MEGTFPRPHARRHRCFCPLGLRPFADRQRPARGTGSKRLQQATLGLARRLLGGWFARDLVPDLRAAIDTLAAAIGPLATVEPEGVAAARSAAFVLSAWEGGRLHAPALASDALSYDRRRATA
jgi:hypothetical protein